MKLKHLMAFIAISSCSTFATAIEVKFVDSAWDGINVPEGQQCQKFSGKKPATPQWTVMGIPTGSNQIVLEYSDRDSKKMNNGGHGMMSFAIDATATNVNIPSVAGHTFELPAKFTMIEAHRGAGWDIEGAYMPPCSGGKDHAYYVTIKTLKNNMITDEIVVEMGKF